MTDTAEIHAARARRWVLFWLAAFWAMVAVIVFPPAPRLVWNVSASAPVGLYGVRPGAPLARGDMAIAWIPKGYRALAATRRYLPSNVPLVKRVAALRGDRICASGRTVSVNGRRVAERQTRDGQGRAMPHWEGCRVLVEGQVFLLMDAAASFDGRYFGVSEQADIVGKAYPLWTR